MLIDLVKRAIPVLASIYGTRFVINKIGPHIPMINRLGAFQGPVLATLAAVGAHYATKKVGKLAKYRTEIMLGTGLNLLDVVVKTFAPASVKSMLGIGDIYDQAMGDYLSVGGMGDYLSVGGTPIDDDIAMSDYIAVGSDGVEEELGFGVEEELGFGVEEELGNDLLGGVSQGAMVRQVPTRGFLEPVPARSFTRNIPAASAQLDNPGSLFQGVFRGGF